MRRPFLLALLLLAGCAAPAQSPGTTDGGDPGNARPAGQAPASEPLAFLDGGGGKNLEPEVAVHPKDPNTALVAWTVRGDGHPFGQVFAAVTQDGGRTWRQTELHDTTLPPIPGRRSSWDSKVAYLPDGTAAVLFAGEMQLDESTGDVLSRITLATSKDNGATWSFAHVAEDPVALSWDYPSLAAAPDTGRLYVTAYMAGTLGSSEWLWTSGDGGKSWDRKPLALTGPLDYTAARIAAGAGGKVYVLAHGSVVAGNTGAVPGLQLLASTDEGKTFEPPRKVARDSQFRSPLLLGDGTLTALVAGDGQSETVRSTDGGKTWPAPATVAAIPAGLVVAWTVGALDGRGGAGYLTTYEPRNPRPGEAAQPPQWGVLWTREDAAGQRTTTELVPTTDRNPSPVGLTASGNEYGGVAFGPDGAAWAVWPDTRDGGLSRIAVLRPAP
jgi:hypothetical protein